MAKASRASTNRVLVGLIEQGIEAREREKRHFFDVAERLAASNDPAEQQILKKELARMTFGS